MPAFDLAGFDAALLRAVAAWKANAPLPPSAGLDAAALAAQLQAAQPAIDKLAAAIEAEPGLIAAADVMLAYFAGLDFAWAQPAKAIVDALPGGLAAARDKLPTIVWLLTTFSPAPGWGPGGAGYQPGPEWRRGGPS